MLGAAPLLLLGTLYYFNYTPPTQRTAMAKHLAYRPKQLSEKREEIISLNLTWLYSVTGMNPQSTSIVVVPFHKSYSVANCTYLVPRAAFFDKRMRGNYSNATVVLTHIIKSLVKPVGCIVDSQYTSKVKLKPVNIKEWIHRYHPECTHDDVLIFCFNTPGRNNSKVSVMYENPKNSSEIIVTNSEHPLFVPKSRESSKEFASSIMACTTAYGTPPYFGAWLRYQKTLGVDLVYINAAESFLYGDAFKDTFLQESLKSGFVQLKVWKEYLKHGALWYYSQALYYQNCVYRFQGVYNYAIMNDFDDFVIPADGKDIIEILQSLFDSHPMVGGIQLDWMRYFEPDGGFNYDEILAGKFAQYVEAEPVKKEHNPKSIHKLTTALDVGIHFVGGRINGYTRMSAPKEKIYLAHFKPNLTDRPDSRDGQRQIHYDTNVECITLCIALVLCVM